MKVSKIILALLLLGSIVILSLGCGSGSDSESAQQTATVQRGNITVDITASGNLALSRTEDLAFEMSGTVAEIMVEEGESVEEGQVLARLDTSEWETELTTLENNLISAEISLKNAKIALEQAEATTNVTMGTIQSTTTDPEEIEILELQVKLAQSRFDNAQKALEEALAASPEVTAPFAGFITKVNVKGGDEVLRGTVAVTLADPDKFEADILVSEMDIYQVAVGGTATVEADAFSGVIIPATVTHISPTATISSGVVNYSVTVEVGSLEGIMAGQQTGQPAAGGTQGPPSGFTPPTDFTPPAGFTPPEGATPPAGFTPPTGGGSPTTSQIATIPANFELRQGMTVTVSLIVQQATNVLLVPNGAITTEGGQSYVQVVSATGAIEKRTITTGITDYVNTEVTEGLSEGETLLVLGTTSSTSTATTSQQGQQGPPGGFFFGQ